MSDDDKPDLSVFKDEKLLRQVDAWSKDGMTEAIDQAVGEEGEWDTMVSMPTAWVEDITTALNEYLFNCLTEGVTPELDEQLKRVYAFYFKLIRSGR